MTIRGGGNPHTAMAAMPLGEWTRRLGALLAEAYDCFMVGTLHGSTEYKRGSRAIARGQWQAPPRIIAWQTTRSRAVCRRARVGQGQAFGGAEEAPSLTLAARDGDGQYAVGAEECSRRGSNKRINKQGRDKMVCTTLDKESPIQAVCPNWARTDLCGGRGVTRVPTANNNCSQRVFRLLTLAGKKRARAKNAQNCFLYRLLLIGAAGTFGFLIHQIETEFLRADCTSEFSRGQTRSRHAA